MRVWLASLFAALFLLLQGAAFAHAAEFGVEHTHDGVVCDMGVLAEDETEVEPTLPVPAVPEPAPAAPFAPAPCVSPDVPAQPARAPPPRGPPATTR